MQRIPLHDLDLVYTRFKPMGVWYLKQVGIASQGGGEGISTGKDDWWCANYVAWVPRLRVTTSAHCSGLPYPEYPRQFVPKSVLRRRHHADGAQKGCIDVPASESRFTSSVGDVISRSSLRRERKQSVKFVVATALFASGPWSRLSTEKARQNESISFPKS